MTSARSNGAAHISRPAVQYRSFVRHIIAQTKQAAAGMAELGYIAMAYISGRSIAAISTFTRLPFVT